MTISAESLKDELTMQKMKKVGEHIQKYKKHPGGRPTKYKPEFCNIIQEVANDPQEFTFLQALSCRLDITIETIMDWSRKKEQFSEALKKGKQAYEKKMTNILVEMKHNPKIYSYLMQRHVGINLDKQEVEHSIVPLKQIKQLVDDGDKE